MIEFSCHSCGRAFSVPAEFAGRSARCKKCGAELSVPAAAADARPQAEALPPMRIRRLMADAQQMRRAFADSPLIGLRQTIGEPPETYQIEYRVRGLQRKKGGGTVGRDHHIAEIQLTSEYPRLAPICKMLTPIFHPNMDPATICIGDHWTAGERLVDLVARIGEMIAYQAYNIRSPLDGEAAMWADLHQKELPVDNRSLQPGETS
jgi:ubiquitin-protein ligase